MFDLLSIKRGGSQGGKKEEEGEGDKEQVNSGFITQARKQIPLEKNDFFRGLPDQ